MYICGVAIGQRPRLGEHQNRPLLEEDWQGIPRLLEEILETCGVGVETGFFDAPAERLGKIETKVKGFGVVRGLRLVGGCERR